jgi:LCP family protein required for cell wall assembly
VAPSVQHRAATADASEVPGHARRGAHKRRRSVLERVLLAVIVVVVAVLLASGALYGYVTYRFHQVHKVAVPSLTAPALTGGPFNLLLVGSDSRVGETSSAQAAQFGTANQVAGARSDVIKILHVDPGAGTATILDIPRDTLVTLSGTPASEGTINRINVPFGTSADALVQTIQSTFGIPIAHYVEIDFFGFEGAVDSLGGVTMDFPYPARDAYSGLAIKEPGCQLLHGAQALAVARARHYEYFADGYWHSDPTSDFGRIQRQDAFLRALLNRAESQYNPLTVNAFLGSVVHDVTIDDHFSLASLISLSQRYHAFSSGSLRSVTLPTYSVGSWGSYGDVLFVQEPAAQQLITSFLGEQPNPAATPPIAPNGYSVRVPVTPPSGSTVPSAPLGTTTSSTTTLPAQAGFNPSPCTL